MAIAMLVKTTEYGVLLCRCGEINDAFCNVSFVGVKPGRRFGEISSPKLTGFSRLLSADTPRTSPV